MMLYIIANPLCTFQEIYKNITPRFNWEDLRRDFYELEMTGCITVLFNKLCYTQPLDQRYFVRAMFWKKVDRLIYIIKENPHLFKNKFFQEFSEQQDLKNVTSIKKSKIKTSLLKYHYIIEQKIPLNQKLFSKFFKLFFLQSKILQLGYKKMTWDVQTISKNQSRIDSHLKEMILIVDEFVSFLPNYDLPESKLKKLYPALEPRLDAMYESSLNCLDIHRCGKKPVNYRIQMLDAIKQNTKNFVAKRYGKTPKQIRNTIKPIIDFKGNPDIDKIAFFKNSEKQSFFN